MRLGALKATEKRRMHSITLADLGPKFGTRKANL